MTALENNAPAVLWPLYVRNGFAVAAVHSKWLRCGHCALGMAVLWPLCARNGCALEMAVLWPLSARSGCVNSTFPGRIHFVRLPRHRKVPYVNLVYIYIYIDFITTLVYPGCADRSVSSSEYGRTEYDEKLS